MYSEVVYTLSCREKASTFPLTRGEGCELLMVGGQQALLPPYKVWGNLKIWTFVGLHIDIYSVCRVLFFLVGALILTQKIYLDQEASLDSEFGSFDDYILVLVLGFPFLQQRKEILLYAIKKTFYFLSAFYHLLISVDFCFFLPDKGVQKVTVQFHCFYSFYYLFLSNTTQYWLVPLMHLYTISIHQ